MARVISINKSDIKGVLKTPFDKGILVENHGLDGDAHADGSHRQLSLLAKESYDKMEALGAGKLEWGSFAENITTEGITLHTLSVGTKLKIGDCLVEVTQIGKQCHGDCEIFKKVGTCVMPKEGIFVRIIIGGRLSVNDEIVISEETVE